MSQGELARRFRIKPGTIGYHVNEMIKSDSIEEAGKKRRVGNLVETLYRAVKRAEYSAKQMLELSPRQQEVIVGMTLQNALAEHLAAFREGEVRGDDPNLILSWNWFNLDEEAEEELCNKLEDTWKEIQEIQARSDDRRTRTKKDARSIVVSLISHPRVRPADEAPLPFGSLVNHMK
jgi:hypothetical protein